MNFFTLSFHYSSILILFLQVVYHLIRLYFNVKTFYTYLPPTLITFGKSKKDLVSNEKIYRNLMVINGRISISTVILLMIIHLLKGLYDYVILLELRY